MLTVHTATGTATLADGLADLLAAPLSDPFAAEVVAVPAKGVERWIVQRLALRLGAVDSDGIAANIEFLNPARLVADVLATCSGVDPDDDEWAPARLRWTVLDVIDGCLDDPWCAVLHRHLTDTPERHRSGRRFATAARIVDVFAGYAAQRPAMPLDWAAGRNLDGAGADLEEDTVWQAELWRRVRARLGTASPAERLDTACTALRADPALVGLPERMSLFGPTRLPTDQLDVLAALGAHRDVHLWLPHPSPAMWDALAGKEVPVRRRATTARSTSRTRCSPGSVATCASCSFGCAAVARISTAHPSPTGRTRCWAGCSPGSSKTSRRRGSQTRKSPTAQSPCTPVTARRGRSRRCVRYCCICSPTIRRWNRATCW